MMILAPWDCLNTRFHLGIYGAVKYVLRLNRPAGRSLFPIYRDDLFLTSFPKSGNTWLRFLTANLLWPDRNVSFETIDQLIPDIYRRPNDELSRQERPRVLKSHESFDRRYPRTIYIVRDPRSVVVSYRRYRQKMGDPGGAHSLQDVARILFEDGASSGTWQDHVGGWVHASLIYPERVLLLRYEDLQLAPQSEVERLARFIGLEPTGQLMTRAIRASSFDEMKRLESQAGAAWEETRESTRSDIPFIRAGRIDEWKQVFEEEHDLLHWIEDRCGQLLHLLGYQFSGGR